MSDPIRSLLLIGIISIRSVALVHGQIMTQAYLYSGGTFSVNTVFNFYTSVEADAVGGTTRFQPILTITNSRTGRSITSSFTSESDFISTIEGNRLIGREIVPSRLLLIRLFQQTPRGSVMWWLARRFRKPCANFSHSSPPKRLVKNTWPPAAGRMVLCVLDAETGVLINW
jgi:hypothetical protein